MVYSVLVIVQVVVALSLVGLILMQHGKGADAGAAFGSGASGTVFGAKGSANFLSRATAALAVVFFAISLTLAYLVNGASLSSGGSVTDQLSQQPAPATSAPSKNSGNAIPNEQPGAGGKANKSASAVNTGTNPSSVGNTPNNKTQPSPPNSASSQGNGSGGDTGPKVPQ